MIFCACSGIVAERVNLRYFLALGMIFSGVFTFLFGLAKYIEVHSIAYFIVIQVQTQLRLRFESWITYSDKFIFLVLSTLWKISETASAPSLSRQE